MEPFPCLLRACVSGDVAGAASALEEMRRGNANTLSGSPNSRDDLAFRTAARHGSASIVALLRLTPSVNPAARRNDALRKACRFGHAFVVDSLLADARVDPATDGHAALAVAAIHGRIAIVDRLLADLRVDPTRCGPQLVVEAAARGQTAVVQRLLADDRIDFWSCSEDAVFKAAAAGHRAAVAVLLADARFDDPEELKFILVQAAKRQLGDLALRLLAHPVCKLEGYSGTEALVACAEWGLAPAVSLLLENPAVDPTAFESIALRLAARRGRLDALDALLTDGRADPASRDNEALRRAAYKRQEAVVRRLLADPRVDPAAKSNAAVRAAARHGHVELLELLLADPRVDPAAFGGAALAEAARSGHMTCLERLLAHRRVNPAANDCAALRAAARAGHTEVVRLLLADPRTDAAARNSAALRNAAAGGHVTIVAHLLTVPSVAPSALCNDALRRAAELGHLVVMERLLADPRVKAQGCSAALQLAARNNYVAVVERLLADARVDPTARGSAALLAASERCNTAVADRLLSDGRSNPSHRKGAAVWARGLVSHSYVVKQWRADEGKALSDIAAAGNFTLPSAAEYGATMECLLADPRTDPSAKDSLVFLVAAERKHIEVIMRLLQDGRADPRKHSGVLLLLAITEGRVDLLDQLLTDARIDLAAGWPQDAAKKQKSAVEHGLLHEELAVGDAAAAAAWNVLLYAVTHGSPLVVQRVLADPRVNVNAKRCAIARIASREQHWPAVEVLLDHPAIAMSAAGPLVLPYAIAAQQSALVERLLSDARVDPAQSPLSALCEAVKAADLPLVMRLLAYPSVLAERAHGIFKAAVTSRSMPILSVLMQLAAAKPQLFNPADESDAALQRAARLGDVAMVQALLADPRVRPTGRFTSGALATAAAAGHVAVVDALLAHPRAELEAHDSEAGYLALHEACSHGHLAMVERLLADPRIPVRGRPADGSFDPVRTAATHGYLDILERLLADPRIDAAAHTPKLLQAAARAGRVDIVERCLATPGLDIAAVGRKTLEEEVAYRSSRVQDAVRDLLLGNAAIRAALAAPPVLATLLTAAAHSNCATHLQVFLDLVYSFGFAPAAVREIVKTAVVDAASSYHIALKAVQRLLEVPELDLRTDGAAALAQAVRRGRRSDVVMHMLADPRVGRGGVLAAAASGYTFDPSLRAWRQSVLRQLLDAADDPALDPSANGSIVLRSCREFWAMEMLLQDPRVDPFPQSGYVLRLALQHFFCRRDEADEAAQLQAFVDGHGIDRDGHSRIDLAALLMEEREEHEPRPVESPHDAVSSFLSEFDGSNLSWTLLAPVADPAALHAALRSRPAEARACRRAAVLLQHASVLHSGLRHAASRPTMLELMQRVGPSAATLAARAWQRRARLIAARQWMLAGNDGARRVLRQRRKVGASSAADDA